MPRHARAGASAVVFRIDSQRADFRKCWRINGKRTAADHLAVRDRHAEIGDCFENCFAAARQILALPRPILHEFADSRQIIDGRLAHLHACRAAVHRILSDLLRSVVERMIDAMRRRAPKCIAPLQ